jgi:hypothetical protein
VEVITASVTSSSKDDLTGTKRSPQSIALFVAMVATGLALGGSLSHLYELPKKIDISREHYPIVQRNYDGWWQLAYVVAAQLVGILPTLLLPTLGPEWSAPFSFDQVGARPWHARN